MSSQQPPPPETTNLFPPGHFYSPIPSLAEMLADEARIFPERPPRQLPGIELDAAGQLGLVQAFRRYYDDMPFQAEKQPGLRYQFDNPAYSYTDGIFLYGMLRHLEPSRIIEVGSGHSSSLMLDTDELFLGRRTRFSFIEPHADLLKSLLREEDLGRVEIIERRVQEVPLEYFASLGTGDILFIDSTHVSKTGSDVNYLVHEVLPSLAPGVVVHIHDIFWPFEYPRQWVMDGRAWTECYILRAFLEFNSAFEIMLFSHYLATFHLDELVDALPLCAKNLGGDIWLRRKS